MALKIGLADTEAVAQKAVVGFFFHPDVGSYLRLENGRTVISKIRYITLGVIAEVVTLGSRYPVPRFLDVVSNSPYRNFRILLAIDGAAMFLRMVALATR